METGPQLSSPSEAIEDKDVIMRPVFLDEESAQRLIDKIFAAKKKFPVLRSTPVAAETINVMEILDEAKVDVSEETLKTVLALDDEQLKLYASVYMTSRALIRTLGDCLLQRSIQRNARNDIWWLVQEQNVPVTPSHIQALCPSVNTSDVVDYLLSRMI